MPNLIYTLAPTQITVTNSFAENVMKLEAVGISANNIIDIYLEAQKYAESIPRMTNPMRFIQAHENQSKPVSLKTLLFVHLPQLANAKGFNAELCTSIFFCPNSAANPICKFTPSFDDIGGIMTVLPNYIKDNHLSETNGQIA